MRIASAGPLARPSRKAGAGLAVVAGELVEMAIECTAQDLLSADSAFHRGETEGLELGIR